ncbi:hypothetical protein FRC00_004357, partial [Tulasnella sp. 408]
MLLSLPSLLAIVHFSSSCTVPHEAQQPLSTEHAGISITLRAGYDTPFGQGEIIKTFVPPLKGEQCAFPAQPGRTNIEIQVFAGPSAPEDVPTVVGVREMGGQLWALYFREILCPFVQDNRDRGLFSNPRCCSESTTTSPTFHHGGSTSDLGAVLTGFTIEWSRSKVYVIVTSLGGVITAKALGQWGDDRPVSAAALISPVYDFPASCKAMETNFVSRNLLISADGAFYTKL